MIFKYFRSAILAGFGAGIIASMLHLAFVQPLLLEAELYESGTLMHGQQTDLQSNEVASNDDHDHDHDHPSNLTRNGLTGLFLCLIYVGYALLLSACFGISELLSRPVSKHSGIIWGICGFAALQLFPAFGLPPELPGSSAPGLEIRQLWWVLTAFATAIGCAALFWNNSLFIKGVGLAIILLPHLIGAPTVSEFKGVVPPELSAHFASRTLVSGLIVWSFLGVFLTHFWLKKWERE